MMLFVLKHIDIMQKVAPISSWVTDIGLLSTELL